MTTASSSVLSPTHTDSASFRAWGKAISDQLAAVGLTQTADTGQVNWATVAYSATTNNNLGYEVWRFNDTLQATTPIFIRLDYGTSNAATRPRLMLTVGAGSDGAGNITSVAYSSFQVDRNTNQSGSGAVNACYSAAMGFLGVGAYLGTTGSNTPGWCFFAIARVADATGAPTSAGYVVYSSAQTTRMDVRVVANGIAGAVNQGAAFVPNGVTSSAVGADVQVYRHFASTPAVVPVPQMLTYQNAEIAEAGTFTATPVGSTSHTYRAMGLGSGYASINLVSTHVIAMLWE